VGAPLEFAATVVGGAATTVERDGFVGYVFGLAAHTDRSAGCLVVQRADDPEPHQEPYCLVWGAEESTTYGGVQQVTIYPGDLVVELTTPNAAELGTPRRFRITFPADRTEEVRAGLCRTLGAEVVG
jgi:hypothetical protein